MDDALPSQLPELAVPPMETLLAEQTTAIDKIVWLG
jgi:hypothetical protein